MTISDEFLELACKALLYSKCETEEDFKVYKAICDACKKNGISVKKFLDTVHDIFKEGENG